MNRPDEAIGGLTSRNFYIDENTSQSSSQLSASEPLLEEELQSTKPILHNPKWRAWLSVKNFGRSRRKPSRPDDDDIREKPMLMKRKRSRLCLKIGLGILVLLYVL